MTDRLIDFFKENYFVAVYGITCIISIFTYRKYFDTPLKYFPILIVYTFFNELLGYLIRYHENFTFFAQEKLLAANDLVYNIYDFIFYGFFFWIFWKLIKLPKHKKIVLTAAFISLLSYTISLFYQDPTIILLFYATAISGSMLLICILLYFFELKPNWDWNMQKYNLMLWVSTGLGVFLLLFPTIIVIGFLDFELWQKLHLRTVLRILIILMYALFIIGFIRARRKTAF